MLVRPQVGDVGVLLGDDYVAEVEICRPPNNFFDVDLVVSLVQVFDELANSECRAVVLYSSGRHFCAGANFDQNTPVHADGPNLYEVAMQLFEQPLPIVAAIQGAAIGGGLGLALVADLRIAAPVARFSANFARLGFHHGFGLTVTLALVVGQQAALDLLYSGRSIDGVAAREISLCDAVRPLADLRTAARVRAAEIARSAPHAVRSIRATMRGHLAEQVRQAMDHERVEQHRLRTTVDWAEGVAASAERREPRFVGR